jgi:hypothetical protein
MATDNFPKTCGTKTEPLSNYKEEWGLPNKEICKQGFPLLHNNGPQACRLPTHSRKTATDRQTDMNGPIRCSFCTLEHEHLTTENFPGTVSKYYKYLENDAGVLWLAKSVNPDKTKIVLLMWKLQLDKVKKIPTEPSRPAEALSEKYGD